ncbi:hypothetical protein GYA54_01785 [Candidatus Kuenenbacteria bacterium]|nr:hypothetical protein [Candidatus Kuenenbacteria bacterium]
MSLTKNDKKIADISTYNTFKVFEDIYNKEGDDSPSWEMTLPKRNKKSSFWASFLIFVFILSVFGVGFYPSLSYLLKTPYPILVMTEDSMWPVIERDDLVLVRGLISKEEIKTNDLVVFKQKEKENDNLAVQRVVDVDREDGQVIVRGETDNSLNVSITASQVVGKVLGEENPVKVPLIGKFIGYLARR